MKQSAEMRARVAGVIVVMVAGSASCVTPGPPDTDAASPDAADLDVALELDTTRVDPSFAFVVIPDTQNEVVDDEVAALHFEPRLHWIVRHEDELDVRFVLQTGDLVNWDTPTHDQFVRASEGLRRLESAAIPFLLAIGNHDTAVPCEGGLPCPGMTEQVDLRNTTTFNTIFPVSRFPWLAGTFEPEKIDNAYFVTRAGGVEWVIVSMELWPRADAARWAGEVLADHPRANGIVFTHDFLRETGVIEDWQGYGETSPRQVFDDVLVHHPNLRFVFSGHQGYSAYRRETGDAGNEIHMFLFNLDDATNPTRVVEVDTEARTVHAHVYAARTDMELTSNGADVMLTGFDFVQ